MEENESLVKSEINVENFVKSRMDIENNTLYLDIPKKLNVVISGGDVSLLINGEINCITKNENICLDTINGQIHLNSRWGKDIRNLPESVEYREKIKEMKEKQEEENLHNYLNSCPLLSRIQKLEYEIEDLRKKCQE